MSLLTRHAVSNDLGYVCCHEYFDTSNSGSFSSSSLHDVVARTNVPTIPYNYFDDLSTNTSDIALYGSSTFTLWSTFDNDLVKSVSNLGFGGSTWEDALFYLESSFQNKIPKTLFLYEGDNDIWFNRDTYNNTLHFLSSANVSLPNCNFVVISPKLAPIRISKMSQYKEYSHFLSQLCIIKGLRFIDLFQDTYKLYEDGVLDEYFVEDQLHFNAQGYQILSEHMNKIIE